MPGSAIYYFVIQSTRNAWINNEERHMGSIGTIITIILVVAWVVKGLASTTGSQSDSSKPRKHRSLQEWDEIQAARRQQMSEQRESLSELRADTARQNPSQMTMAQRIELARQRARQQAGLSIQNDEQAEALRRARVQAERQAQQQRQAAEQRAQRERATRQERAQRERAERIRQQRRRQAQQQAQQRRRAKQQRRQRAATRATTGSQRQRAVAKPTKRVQQGTPQLEGGPTVTKRAGSSSSVGIKTSVGTLSRADLRKAFIMKELLDKPVALRDPQADLLS